MTKNRTPILTIRYPIINCLLLSLSFSFSSLKGEFSNPEQHFHKPIYRIRGKLDGLTDNLIYLKSGPKQIDTVQAQNGLFTFQSPLHEPVYCELTIQGAPGVVRLIWDGDILLMGDARSLENVEVIGSPLTDAYHQFYGPLHQRMQELIVAHLEKRRLSPTDTILRSKLSQIMWDHIAQQQAAARSRIVEQPDSWFSLYLLYQELSKLPKAGLAALYNGLSPTLKNHTLAKEIEKLLR